MSGTRARAEEIDPTGAVAGWWSTAISDIEPGRIALRGVPIADLITERSFVDVVWLMVNGVVPRPEHRRLLEAALVASVDHGPQAPSVASARMAATCGVGLNSAVANGVNTLGEVHGGAGRACVELLDEIVATAGDDGSIDDAAAGVVARWRARDPYLPGFGHRFHPIDPRREPLLRLLTEARDAGMVVGRHLAAALAVEALLAVGRSRPVPINVDGLTAAIYGELGVAPELAQGLFVLGRSVGILAHAWEQTQQGGRIKGPIPPPLLPRYSPDA